MSERRLLRCPNCGHEFLSRCRRVTVCPRCGRLVDVEEATLVVLV